jgi:hypothetical protein
MSGGGQRGGEPNPPPKDGHNIVGLDLEEFKSHAMGTIFKILAPSIFSSVTDPGQYWNDNKDSSNNSDIKEAIFKTLISTYLKDVEEGLTIETAEEDVDEDYVKGHLVQDTSMSFVDITNTQMKFDIANQLLTIEIITKIPKKPVVGGGMFDSEEEDSFGDNSSEEYSESAAEENSFRDNSSEEDDLEDEDSNDPFISEVEEEGEFYSESSSDSESE